MSPEAPEYTRSIDNTTPTEGLAVFDTLYNAAQDLRSGDVTNLVDSARGLVEEAGNLMLDPVGGIAGSVVEWIMQHVDPLKTWINQLTGDSGQVYGMSASWDSISSSLASIAEELENAAASDFADMHGEAVRAYQERQAVVYSAINGVSEASGAFGEALSKVADSVDNIHDAVVSAIADIVVTCFEVVAEEVCTFGLATPVAAAQVAGKTSKWVGRIEPILEVLVNALQAIEAIYAVMTSAGDDLTRGVEHIGEQCQAPGGGCCGEGGSTSGTAGSDGSAGGGSTANGGTSGGTSVGGDNSGTVVGGDNNGTINNGDVDNSEDRHIEVNPSIEPHIDWGGGKSDHDGGGHDGGGDHKGGDHKGNHNGDHKGGNHNGDHKGGNHNGGDHKSGNNNGDHKGGNHNGGNHKGGNHSGGDHKSGNNNGDHKGGNHNGGNHKGGNHNGGSHNGSHNGGGNKGGSHSGGSHSGGSHKGGSHGSGGHRSPHKSHHHGHGH